MRLCEQCGNSLRIGATYCDKCGKKNDVKSTKNAKNEIWTYTCVDCGSKEITHNPNEFFGKIILIILIASIAMFLLEHSIPSLIFLVLFYGVLYLYAPRYFHSHLRLFQSQKDVWSVKCKSCGKIFLVKKPPIGYSTNLTGIEPKKWILF